MSQRILIIGSEGSIGKRWCAVARSFGHTVHRYDLGSPESILATDVDRVLIASPTETHLKYLLRYGGRVPILCEKPLCTNINTINTLKTIEGHHRIQMVNNWTYFSDQIMEPGNNIISYDHYAGGHECEAYNFAQPIYLAKSLSISYKSPTLKIVINGARVQLENIEFSYLQTYRNWIEGQTLWELDDAKRMILKINRWEAIRGR